MRYCPDAVSEADAEDAHLSHADGSSEFDPLLRNDPSNDGGFERYGALFDERSGIASVTPGSPLDTGDVTELRSETANRGTHAQNDGPEPPSANANSDAEGDQVEALFASLKDYEGRRR